MEVDSNREEEKAESSEDDDPSLDLLAPLSAALEASAQRAPPVSGSRAAVLINYGKKLEDSTPKATLAKYRVPENRPTLGLWECHAPIKTSGRP